MSVGTGAARRMIAASMTTGTLVRYDYYYGPKALDDMWTLSRGALKLRCALSTHQLGWELRLTAGSNFLRSQVCKSETAVAETAEAWRQEAAAKGWT